MEEIVLSTPSMQSTVHCGSGAFEAYAKIIGGNIFIITDSNVYKFYGGLMEKTFAGAPAFVLPAGEKSKNHKNLIAIFEKMIESGVTRKSTVIAFGGGVVGDIAGLAASLYMRGINVVQIPTTLLSQVDSSVGGKTAIDFKGIKNVLGSFYQPSRVIVDPTFLKTLPAREIRCGLGEIIKYGAIDGGIYDRLLKNCNRLFDLDFLEQITADCIRHKAKVVSEDEKDLLGARKTLNLGHTTGHAFELYYKRKSHGEFVLIGAYYEVYIAEKAGVCDKAYADILRGLIKKVIKVPAYADAEKAALFARFDKKNAEQTNVSIIVPKVKGVSEEMILPIEEYARLIAECARQIEVQI